MRKLLFLLLSVLFMLYAEGAIAKTYEFDHGFNGYFVCEDFEDEMPRQAEQIFAGLIHAGDEVICGTIFQIHYRNDLQKLGRGGALLAVRRNGKILLMSANTNGDVWHAGIETDCFLPADAQFKITGLMKGMYVHLTIHYQDVAYEIRTTSDGGAYLYKYSWMDENENKMYMDCYRGKFTLCKERLDGVDEMLAAGNAIPDRLAAWTAEALPRTVEDLCNFEMTNPFVLNDDEAYIVGVNLRENATGKSKTWGKYTAKVQILGQKAGSDAPWFNVRVGNLEGWASGIYVHRQRKETQEDVYGAAVTLHPVGRIKRRTALLQTHGGESIMQLEQDVYVHVLGECDGFLHVIVPRGELTWMTDWDGIYGFVRKEDLAVGISKADASWKKTE